MPAASVTFYPLNVQTFVNVIHFVKTWATTTIQTPMMKKSKNENLCTLFWIYSIYLKNSYFSCFSDIPIISREMLQNTLNFLEMIPAIFKFEFNSDNYNTNSWTGFIKTKNVRILSIIEKSASFCWRQQKFYFSKKNFFHQFKAPVMMTSCAKFQWVLLSLYKVMTILLLWIYGICQNCVFFMFYLNLNNFMKNVANHFKLCTDAPWYINIWVLNR